MSATKPISKRKLAMAALIVAAAGFSAGAIADSQGQQQAPSLDNIDWASYLGYWFSGSSDSKPDTGNNNPGTEVDSDDSQPDSPNSIDQNHENDSVNSQHESPISNSRAHEGSGHTPHSNQDNWRVVTVGNTDGFVLYPTNRQWVSAECMTTLHNAGAAVETVKWGTEISDRPETTDHMSCSELVFAFSSAHCVIGQSAAGSSWRVVTVSNNGDGYLLFADNTRRWLNHQCISSISNAGISIHGESWDAVKDRADASQPYACDNIISTLSDAGDSSC